MSATEFASLPDDARVWVFAASRPLAPGEQAHLEERVDAFLARWQAHGRTVVGARDLRHAQFLLVAADERATGVSGCSIDSLFHTLGEIQDETGVKLLDSTPVWYRDVDGQVRTATRPEFRQLARTGAVGDDTVVFDNTVATVGDLRAGRWETPMRNAWHARAFAVAATTPG
ncbi:MAG TPA: hypothetical protein VFE05_22475 [Longimicrobiaceae bacterium]|jgi:hypothetical protein|nr:hypothetical protein [Longimicrobiaceae bacterium]